jgi:signal transduction histidine kinase
VWLGPPVIGAAAPMRPGMRVGETGRVIRRYPLAAVRCLALVGLAVVGLATALLAGLATALVVVYPAAVAVMRRLADLGRRLARAWGGVPIAAEYLPGPPVPQRRDDGWYVHGSQLYKSPRVPAFLLKMEWLTKDPTIVRDWLWLFLTPCLGGLAALLPPLLIATGATAPFVGWMPVGAAVPVGLALVFVGLAIGPAMLRVHARWSRVLLQPAASSWWHRSGAAASFARRSKATWAGGGMAGMSFGAVGFLVLQVLSIVVWWGGLLPQAASVTRPYLDYYRRKAREWTGAELDPPYRPLPEPPQRDSSGLYRAGRTLHANPRAAARAQRYGWVFKDPATWRDMAWMATAPLISVVGIVPAALVAFGFFGLVWQPVWWWPWAVPIGLATGEWVTPWYMWYAVTYLVPALDVVPGWASPLVGLGLTGLGLALAMPLLRLRLPWDRLLLTPTKASQLAHRVRRLTETRADAVDAQAAELRRIERDLHDGAQARMVAVGLSLGTIEHLMERDPDAARALLAQARETSATALTELRDLVRGIHPPILAERGLADAVRALALDSPLPVAVTVELDGRPEPPVESAAYFAISEAIANAIRHAGATRADVDIRHEWGALRITVADDGHGGADPARGTGLRGVRRRLGTFDGVLSLQSPRGGPTVLTMEIPCVLSSPRTSTS